MTFYIYSNGKQSGPMTEEEVRAGIRDGVILPSDLAIPQGGSDWQPVSALISLPQMSVQPSAGTETPPLIPGKKSGLGCFGIGILVVGLLALLGGGILAITSHNRIDRASNIFCQSADKYQAEADAAYEVLKRKGLQDTDLSKIPYLPAEDRKAISTFQDKLYAANLWSGSCAESLNSFRRYRLAGVAIAVFGFLGTLVSLAISLVRR
jgi:hypothetical protein